MGSANRIALGSLVLRTALGFDMVAGDRYIATPTIEEALFAIVGVRPDSKLKPCELSGSRPRPNGMRLGRNSNIEFGFGNNLTRHDGVGIAQ